MKSILLRCIGSGCTPAWFRLEADPSGKPAGSAAPLVHCPYCANAAPFELLFAAAAGSTQVAHEVVLDRDPASAPGTGKRPMVRFRGTRPGDKAPPLVPPESERRDHACLRCATRYSTYRPGPPTCPTCGQAT